MTQFEIHWEKSAEKTLRKLPGTQSRRIWDKVGQLQQNPFRLLQHYEGHAVYKLRVGDYGMCQRV